MTVGKTTYELPAFSFAIATMNPVELGQGTFPLSEAATDRFAIMITIGYLPVRGRTKTGQLRLQAGSAEPTDGEGAHHRAAGGHQREGVPARASRRLHPATGRRDAPVQSRTPTGGRTPRPSSSSGASTWARRPGPSSAGAGSPRSGRSWSGSGPRSIPRTSRTLRPTCSATGFWLGPHAASHGLTTEAVIADVIERVPVP